MESRFNRVMAVPNECTMKARVISAERSRHISNKWQLEIEILDSTSVFGPNFAKKGQVARAFTFCDPGIFAGKDACVTTRAEFIGDENGGQFQLIAMQRQECSP